MPYSYNTQLLEWDNSSSTCSGGITLPVDVFDSPGTMKYIYKVYLVYTSTVAQAMNATLLTARNGATIFSGADVPSTTLPITSSPTVGVIEFTTKLLVNSLQLYIAFTNNNITIRDIIVEYRPIYKRTT